MRRTEYFSELIQDVTFAFRQLLKNPGFTVVAVITLALGIGATTAIFSAVHAVVLRPLPFPDPDRILAVYEDYRSGRGNVSAGNYVDGVEPVQKLRATHRHPVFQLQSRRRGPGRAHRRRPHDRGVLPRVLRSPQRWAACSPATKISPGANRWSCSAIVCGRGASASDPAIVGKADHG